MRPRYLGSMMTVRLGDGAVSVDQEHLEWFKEVVYARQGQVCDVLQQVVKRSYVDWCGKCAG